MTQVRVWNSFHLVTQEQQLATHNAERTREGEGVHPPLSVCKDGRLRKPEVWSREQGVRGPLPQCQGSRELLDYVEKRLSGSRTPWVPCPL